ncbi:MAG: signal peptidase I [Verrucomicrobia bacterium]|nr:signal peptidase I [Verrucomicrobiota bacterium]
MFIFRWLTSGTFRQAVDLRRQVRKWVNHQRDLLAPDAIAKVDDACESLRRMLDEGAGPVQLREGMSALERVANDVLIPYPNTAWRDNVEVILVAVAVAMGIRTFFLQPFKIPTGSMQPTLYGVHFEDLRAAPDDAVPGFITRFFHATLGGTFYHVIKAEADGVIVDVLPPKGFILPKFLLKTQTVVLRYRGDDGREYDKSHKIWFSPEDGHNGNLRGLTGFPKGTGSEFGFALTSGRQFKKGEYVLRLKDVAGDHVFVDRLTYNFRRPVRGETMVFETTGISSLPQNQFYIKRMVAMGGERVRIGNDRHLCINGVRLDSTTPHFEHIYHFHSNSPPRDSTYSGHLNELVGRLAHKPGLARLFTDETAEYELRPDHYMVMGDNTMNSSDSRYWGDFSRTNVIGKACFVYWPITGAENDRFGWAIR